MMYGDTGMPKAILAGALALLAFYKFVRSLDRQKKVPSSQDAYIRLRVLDGTAAGSVFSFTPTDDITIGRKATNSVVLSDTGVSGRHCTVAFDGRSNVWRLADVGSLNGTFLNRVLIAPDQRSESDQRPLSNGDIVLIGETTKLEVECSPANPRVQQGQEGRAAGDNIAQVLLSHLEQSPLPQEILESITSFAHAPTRLKGAKIQKLGSRAKASGTCEDTCSWILPSAESSGMCTFCVCDGHCGHETAQQVQALLPGMLQQKINGRRLHGTESFKEAMEDTFLDIDKRVEGKDGCTMTLLLLDADASQNVYIQASNVGDSAVVCADFGQMMKMHLTDNHRVTQTNELERLKQANALLTHNGTRLMGLNLSRSIGDRALKDENFGFIATPYVSTVVKVEPSDSLLLVMASDGLWDVTNADLIMKIAHRVLKTDNADMELLAKCLMYHAISRRSLDDITILVVLVDSITTSS